MNETASTTVDSQLLDQLSAYLDGELDDAGCRHVEGLLSTNPRAREQLRQLELASQALDALPRSATNPEFARSTVEMVAVSLADETAADGPSGAVWGRVRGVLLSTVVLASMLVIGYRVCDLLVPDANQQLLGDLPVLEQLDELRQIDSLEFLRKLHASGSFREAPVDREYRP